MQVKLERADALQAKTMDNLAEITRLSGISEKCEQELDDWMVPTHNTNTNTHTLCLALSHA
jgi:hypothetical protein